jgi:predicted amidophosphoribosyltransferase
MFTHLEPCSSESFLDGVVAAGFYHDPHLRQVIWSLKYRGGTCVLPDVTQFIREWRETRRVPWPWAGLPSVALVPLHSSPRRVRERGFDQAVLLTGIFHKEILPWARLSDLLVRTKETPAQATLDAGPLRAMNIRDAFQVVSKELPENVVLVDDVATTGATLSEAARILKNAGVRRVYAIVLAMGK